MDNLTHSLAAALLGRMGLKLATGRAMPTLIIAANLPDIDSFIAPLIGRDPLAFHRGFTHGVGGWLVMPFVASGLVLLWNKFRPAKERVRPWAVLLLAAIGTLSHPLLDLMNTYGIQLFQPLSDRWVYGDTLFIIDPWIWIALILGLELSWRSERLGRNWARPALAVCATVAAYVTVNAGISARAESLTRKALERSGIEPTMIVPSPVPITTWERRVLWRNGEVAGTAHYQPFARERLRFERKVVPLRLSEIPARREWSSDLRALLFWSRMPMVIEKDGVRRVTDQRFADRSGNFGVDLE